MREELIEAMAWGFLEAEYGDGLEWAAWAVMPDGFAHRYAEGGLDALLVFLTEHADEWMAEAGREWCDYSHWISEPEDLLAVLSADREDADGVS